MQSGAAPIVHEARTALTLALEELRELTQGIHPTLLVERGLAVALEELCRRAGLPAHLKVDLDVRLPDQVETAAYYFASEALSNAVKHSHGSEIRVAVSHDGPDPDRRDRRRRDRRRDDRWRGRMGGRRVGFARAGRPRRGAGGTVHRVEPAWDGVRDLKAEIPCA